MSTPIWTRLLNVAGTAPSCGLRGFIQTHIGVLVAVKRSDPSRAAVVSTVWNFVDVVQFFVDGDWLEPRTCPTHTSSIAQCTGVIIVHAGGARCHRAMPSSIDVHSTSGRSQGGESGTWPADESQRNSIGVVGIAIGEDESPSMVCPFGVSVATVPVRLRASRGDQRR